MVLNNMNEDKPFREQSSMLLIHDLLTTVIAAFIVTKNELD